MSSVSSIFWEELCIIFTVSTKLHTAQLRAAAERSSTARFSEKCSPSSALEKALLALFLPFSRKNKREKTVAELTANLEKAKFVGELWFFKHKWRGSRIFFFLAMSPIDN